MIDGEQQARRVTSDLLDVRFIVRARVERLGDSWEAHPLAGDPDTTVAPVDGPTTFVYRRRGGVPLQAFELLDGRRVRHIGIAGSLVLTGLYSETGRLIERSLSLRGDPAWN